MVNTGFTPRMNSHTLTAFVIAITSLELSMKASELTISSGAQHGFKNVQVWPACTPKNCNIWDEFKRAEIPNQPFVAIKDSRTENIMGCFMSHYLLWNHCITRNEPILILEHDAVFIGGFPNRGDVPEFKGILSIARPSYGGFRTPNGKGVHPLTSKKYLPGAHGYIITPDAASDLIELAHERPRPTDIFIHSDDFPWIQEYYPWIVYANDSFSTVQSPAKGLKAKHSFQRNPDKYVLIDP